MIIIGADFVPTASNLPDFAAGNKEILLGTELISLLDRADCRIFNLEMPLCDKPRPISKCGPNLWAPTDAAKLYKSLSVNLFTLANNHILDQGIQGLHDTEESLERAGIAYVGVGENVSEASEPYVFVTNGKKVGIYACTEHEFSTASEHSAGANPFDPLESPDHVARLKEHCDYVIVLYHGGKEHYRYPAPKLQKTCRKLIEKGADLVICQHSHCIGCEEKLLGGTIIYGQGNFLFDDSNSEYWQTSLLVEIGDSFEVSYVPIVKTGNAVRLADDEQAKAIMQGFYCRSKEIRETGVIENRYTEFSNEWIDNCLFSLSGKHSIFFRIFNRLSGGRLIKWYVGLKYGVVERNTVRNYMECEAWQEMILKGLKNE